MPKLHVFSTSARQELLAILTEAADPLVDPDRRALCIRDAIEMLQEDNLRAGYARRLFERIIDDGEHMVWTGAGQDSPDGRPICDLDGRRVYAAKAVWLVTRLERIPDDEALKKTCNVARCVAPRCHRRVLRATIVGGRPPAVRRDEQGRPVCKFGHLLKREPKPREHIYCPPCEHQKRTDYEAAQRARSAVQRFQAASQAQPLRLPPDANEDAPGPQHEPDSARAVEIAKVAAEVDSLFT